MPALAIALGLVLPLPALAKSDLSTSTKTVSYSGSGDVVVGTTLQYTITLIETGGKSANNASVTDEIPANVTGFTVTGVPAGATDSSTGAGTGTNGTGFLNVTAIVVPANGSVTITFTVQVAAGTANCTSISNTATVTDPGGTGAAPSAPSVIVAESSCTAAGNKILYVYDNTTAGFHAALSRIPQPANTGTAITVNAGSTQDFTLTPALQKSLKFANTPDVGNVAMTVNLVETGGLGCVLGCATTVELRTGAGVSIATSGSVNAFSGAALVTYSVTVPKDTVVAAGGTLVLRVHDNGLDTVSVSQKTAGQGASTLSFNTPTVINVDSISFFNAAYPAVTTQPVFVPNQTVFVRAVVSDPFGSADISSALLGIRNPSGTVLLSHGVMTLKNDSGAATKTFEYAYTTPVGAPVGFWTAMVTANEGTEGTVSHSINAVFDVDVPALLVMKTVSAVSDPAEGTTRPKAIPGAVLSYVILVQNNGRGPADGNSLVITDPIPANTKFVIGSVVFTDGGTASGMTLTAANVTYSNNGGTSYVYTPVNDGSGADPAVTNIRMNPQGSMNGKTGATAPSFTVTFQVVVL
ncbi:MAG TPA: hypothetical protein VGT99_05825 [Gammaproteobacteria bacterium]|nr:hypothetical protein [Gammaproteobacteria bacterium]